MQAIGADHHIEVARGTAFKGDVHAGGTFVDCGNAIFEERFDLAIGGPIYGRSKIAPRQTW